ncbi:Uracil-DNA glycosylase, family 1 [Liberibacter crescens BT-1]|uniref:Uracil-DNA glycosylase n=2 Tax=Liberibacter crescens TaxID=1273132 RepID=L0EV42_LIBCB|nr:Uracil-DNA glycosylase, family 1 [Liberibacter crescens BT-1]
MNDIILHESWKLPLLDEFCSSYMQDLKDFLLSEKKKGKRIFPKGSEYFRALDLTPLSRISVVILGQDPYHAYGQAHGLCFSVLPGIRLPPSLINIYKELKEDLQIIPPLHGFLESWARQGVLLLNSVLTVEEGRAASHQGKGWERFTDAVIRIINNQCEHVVFMLWGSYAQKKGEFLDKRRHYVLKAAHPSPLSAHNGFFGCRHFSKANEYLQAHDRVPIDWYIGPVTAHGAYQSDE